MTETIRLWRCTRCGKWSHAKRQPKQHRRFMRAEPDDCSVIERVEPTYSHLAGFEDEGGVIVACGPFEMWIATRDGVAA
jgi:hypothetical protein